ncbi:hypothetical protein AYI69_g8640 [Smittium culicis]|uniref:Uncharacterized protein n=1 Tax=Smittium culicis TaxID=133412 RepID=A0A1R1XIA6_9FUNG|nr:hypothetical protein AYI69_g8640 [Smittium culicis]
MPRSSEGVDRTGTTTPLRKREKPGARGSVRQTRIPVTDLTAYPELTEVLPSIEEDFFRSPLTEEERKIAIHSCLRTSSMNYSPPPLNDSASSAVNKAHAALYGIQVALAKATRPTDYFFHKRNQINHGLDTSEDPEVMFASTMRALLSDVAATVTQARLDNLHKGLELPGKPTELVEPDSKLLMDQESLDALISKKPAAKHQRVQTFRKRQQSSNNKNSIRSNSITAQSINAATTAEAISNHKTSERQSNFCGRADGTWRGPFGPTPSELLSNTTADFTHSSVQEEVEPGGQQSSDRGSRFLDIKASYQRDSAEGYRLLQPAFHDPDKDRRPQNSLGPLKAQPTCGGAELQDGYPIIYLPHGSENQDQRSSTRGQKTSECWPDDIEMSGELYWESPSNVDRSPTWPSNAPTTPGTQELLSVDIEIMDIDSEADEPSHPEPIILEEPAEIMERSIVLASDPGIGDLHGSSDSAWGIVVGHHTYSGS